MGIEVYPSDSIINSANANVASSRALYLLLLFYFFLYFNSLVCNILANSLKNSDTSRQSCFLFFQALIIHGWMVNTHWLSKVSPAWVKAHQSSIHLICDVHSGLHLPPQMQSAYRSHFSMIT